MLASETWGLKGLPDNPKAWLYTVVKNKTRDYLRRNAVFTEKIAVELKQQADAAEPPELDLSHQNIQDSQLQMMFALCHPGLPQEAQIGLVLRLLCGFGIEEIADAFLSNKETINKRLFRAKEKLRTEGVRLELPDQQEIDARLETVLAALYLLFNEGYYSLSQAMTLRKELCLEAMRLTYLLLQNRRTNAAVARALLSLMCFHASRFDARVGEGVLRSCTKSRTATCGIGS